MNGNILRSERHKSTTKHIYFRCRNCSSKFYTYSHWTSLARCQTTGAARSFFMNVWSLGTSASPLTFIEVIPVLPECLRSFLTKYKQDKTTRIVLVFTWRASPTNLCLHVLLFNQVTFSITDALTPWMCCQEPIARLVLSV